MSIPLKITPEQPLDIPTHSMLNVQARTEYDAAYTFCQQDIGESGNNKGTMEEVVQPHGYLCVSSREDPWILINWTGVQHRQVQAILIEGTGRIVPDMFKASMDLQYLGVITWVCIMDTHGLTSGHSRTWKRIHGVTTLEKGDATSTYVGT